MKKKKKLVFTIPLEFFREHFGWDPPLRFVSSRIERQYEWVKITLEKTR